MYAKPREQALFMESMVTSLDRDYLRLATGLQAHRANEVGFFFVFGWCSADTLVKADCRINGAIPSAVI